MIKSPKSKVQGPKSIKNIGLLFVIVLLLVGCVTTQEYVYEDDVFRKEEQKVEENQSGGKKEKWIGSYLEKDNFIKQCPVCKRRYQISLEKCPYDGAKLEEITR
ncbi:MAG: hypothetical protein K9L95_03020 [Candidatus Omnitrophica bacterium]|nr:hypothetical protein [Candidatus Omnitrophota bacterium]MCF7877521.1 hypothetical protein [Candidatus Omnitrophota bacterium]MCF7878424.1 hypothetical protein [Candidatus Omnitrophota bacterium]MCF7892931.1 hypothetical protein [Candidatus Omnitrophota bacterium]